MQQRTLLRVSLFVSVVGLVVLFLVTPDISPQSIVLEGEILGVDDVGSVSFINFLPYDFTVVSFEDVNASGSATLVGKLASYDGRVEFVVEDVK